MSILGSNEKCTNGPADTAALPHELPEGRASRNGDAAGWRCAKCDARLVAKSTLFAYMGMTFSHEALRCPVCGMVLISKELADGKMAEVEQLMEDK